jgi:hypothetical protein
MERRIVSERESFLLRMDGKLLAALRKWSEDEMRSTNSQVEFLLRSALIEAGRLPKVPKPGSKAENGEAAG